MIELRKIDTLLMNGNVITCQVNNEQATFVEVVLHAVNSKFDPFPVAGFTGPFIAMAIAGCG